MEAKLDQAPRSKWRKFVLQAFAGGLVGAGFSVGITQLVDSGALGAFSAAQEAAMLVAMLYVVIGLVVGLGVAVPRAGASMLNVEDEEELREQRSVLAWSALSMVLIGVLLGLLALSGQGGLVDPALALGVIAAGWVVLAILGWYLMRNLDELMRALSRESAELAYYLLFVVCGGWATLAWLGFVPGMGMLAFLTLCHALLLLACFIATARRGMMAPR